MAPTDPNPLVPPQLPLIRGDNEACSPPVRDNVQQLCRHALCFVFWFVVKTTFST